MLQDPKMPTSLLLAKHLELWKLEPEYRSQVHLVFCLIGFWAIIALTAAVFGSPMWLLVTPLLNLELVVLHHLVKLSVRAVRDSKQN